MSISDMALAAMTAGLRRERLPNMGNKLTNEQLMLVNRIYDEARNWAAGSRVKANG